MSRLSSKPNNNKSNINMSYYNSQAFTMDISRLPSMFSTLKSILGNFISRLGTKASMISGNEIAILAEQVNSKCIPQYNTIDFLKNGLDTIPESSLLNYLLGNSINDELITNLIKMAGNGGRNGITASDASNFMSLYHLKNCLPGLDLSAAQANAIGELAMYTYNGDIPQPLQLLVDISTIQYQPSSVLKMIQFITLMEYSIGSGDIIDYLNTIIQLQVKYPTVTSSDLTLLKVDAQNNTVTSIPTSDTSTRKVINKLLNLDDNITPSELLALSVEASEEAIDMNTLTIFKNLIAEFNMRAAIIDNGYQSTTDITALESNINFTPNNLELLIEMIGIHSDLATRGHLNTLLSLNSICTDNLINTDACALDIQSNMGSSSGCEIKTITQEITSLLYYQAGPQTITGVYTNCNTASNLIPCFNTDNKIYTLATSVEVLPATYYQAGPQTTTGVYTNCDTAKGLTPCFTDNVIYTLPTSVKVTPAAYYQTGPQTTTGVYTDNTTLPYYGSSTTIIIGETFLHFVITTKEYPLCTNDSVYTYATNLPCYVPVLNYVNNNGFNALVHGYSGSGIIDTFLATIRNNSAYPKCASGSTVQTSSSNSETFSHFVITTKGYPLCDNDAYVFSSTNKPCYVAMLNYVNNNGFNTLVASYSGYSNIDNFLATIRNGNAYPKCTSGSTVKTSIDLATYASSKITDCPADEPQAPCLVDGKVLTGFTFSDAFTVANFLQHCLVTSNFIYSTPKAAYYGEVNSTPLIQTTDGTTCYNEDTQKIAIDGVSYSFSGSKSTDVYAKDTISCDDNLSTVPCFSSPQSKIIIQFSSIITDDATCNLIHSMQTRYGTTFSSALLMNLITDPAAATPLTDDQYDQLSSLMPSLMVISSGNAVTTFTNPNLLNLNSTATVFPLLYNYLQISDMTSDYTCTDAAINKNPYAKIQDATITTISNAMFAIADDNCVVDDNAFVQMLQIDSLLPGRQSSEMIYKLLETMPILVQYSANITTLQATIADIYLTINTVPETFDAFVTDLDPCHSYQSDLQNGFMPVSLRAGASTDTNIISEFSMSLPTVHRFAGCIRPEFCGVDKDKQVCNIIDIAYKMSEQTVKVLKTDEINKFINIIYDLNLAFAKSSFYPANVISGFIYPILYNIKTTSDLITPAGQLALPYLLTIIDGLFSFGYNVLKDFKLIKEIDVCMTMNNTIAATMHAAASPLSHQCPGEQLPNIFQNMIEDFQNNMNNQLKLNTDVRVIKQLYPVTGNNVQLHINDPLYPSNITYFGNGKGVFVNEISINLINTLPLLLNIHILLENCVAAKVHVDNLESKNITYPGQNYPYNKAVVTRVNNIKNTIEGDYSIDLSGINPHTLYIEVVNTNHGSNPGCTLTANVSYNGDPLGSATLADSSILELA